MAGFFHELLHSAAYVFVYWMQGGKTKFDEPVVEVDFGEENDRIQRFCTNDNGQNHVRSDSAMGNAGDDQIQANGRQCQNYEESCALTHDDDGQSDLLRIDIPTGIHGQDYGEEHAEDEPEGSLDNDDTEFIYCDPKFEKQPTISFQQRSHS
jgi:hypothetical protein